MQAVLILGERKPFSIFKAFSLFCMARPAPGRTSVNGMHTECGTHPAALQEPTPCRSGGKFLALELVSLLQAAHVGI